MCTFKQKLGNYNGLADVWNNGLLPVITIPANPSGSYIITGKVDPYWGYIAGRPYIGMRPPPPLFGPQNYPFLKLETPMKGLGPGEIIPVG